MSNKEIAALFRALAEHMELLDENAFKIRSYKNAYNTIRRIKSPLAKMSVDEILKISGIGNAISEKIQVILETKELPQLGKIKGEIPAEVTEMLRIKGLGAKKIQKLWKEEGIDDLVKLKRAIDDGSLMNVKGFGPKLLERMDQSLEFYLHSKGKALFAEVDELLADFHAFLQNEGLESEITYAGEMYLKRDVIGEIHILSQGEKFVDLVDCISDNEGFNVITKTEDVCEMMTPLDLPLFVYDCGEKDISKERYLQTEALFVKSCYGNTWKEKYEDWRKNYSAELPAECLDLEKETWEKLDLKADQLVKPEDIKGIIHSHSTYSDGLYSIEEMVEACIERSYEYYLISDHSQAAFYANGLDEDRLRMQMDEVDALNEEFYEIEILKGIECDILNDGSMDLNDEILSELDVVIASVHSNLNMDKQKAMKRILSAVENPHVDILGHMTGRILLSRKGYPLDTEKVIRKCAETGTIIELNANPKRLDIDSSFLKDCQMEGVKISINPDAHSIAGIDLIKYGVLSARRGGLKTENCINTYPLHEFLNALK